MGVRLPPGLWAENTHGCFNFAPTLGSGALTASGGNMRAARCVRLMVSLAVLVGALALGAASASAFSLSSSTSTNQAGAPTNLSFTYVATGTQALSRLDVQLPPGVMHDPSSTPTCPVASFQVDRCPASSSVASVATVITVGLTQVSVPGTAFHIADPADDSDFSLGIVLRPPLSALALTRKIYLRGRAVIQGNGSLRHSITGDLSSVSVLGVPVRSRMQRMSLTFTGRNATGNQTYNSTSCATTHLRAQATFSDGTNESRTAPYSAVGCDRLIFTGGYEFRAGSTGAPKKSFAAKLGGVARAPAGVTHEYHRVGGSLDISELGDWDTSDLDAEPTCTDSEFITNTCPIRSQIGTVTVGIEGFPGTRSGGVFSMYPRGAKPRAAIQLRQGETASFTVDFATGADGRSSLEVDGLPQLPLTDISIDVSAPVFVPKGKPASCSNREARGVIRGHNGGQTNTTAKYPPEACPPNVSFADTGDADADGDGFADKSLKPWNFHVWYAVADGGNGIDPETARCELESPNPATAVRGKVKVVRDTGNGYTGCAVEEAGGDVTVVFSVASLDGHVTVLKSSYNVDSEAPVVSSIAPEPVESSSTSVELPFEFTDDRIAHPQSVYEIECVIEDESGAKHTTSPGHKYIDPALRKGGGECMWDTGRSGRFRLEIVVRDSGGHVTVLKRTAVVDAQGPVITVTDPRDQDDDGDGMPNDAIRLSSFNVPFTVGGDDDIDPATFSCKLINPIAMDKGLRVADLDGDGIGDACEVADAPGGENTVEISAADYRGHVTVLKLAYTVDTDAPVIETTAPDKVVYDLSTFDFEFEFTDDTARHPQSKFKAGAEIEIKVGVMTSSAKIVTDRDTGRSKGFARFENVPDGDHVMTLTVEDSTGHVTVLKLAFTVDAQGPAIRLADTRDEDSDGDGMADDQLRSGDFIVPFSVSDEPGLDNDDVQCSVAQTNPAFQENKASGNMPDGGQLFCPVRPPSSGPVLLTITATSVGGHVTVLKIGFVVDATPPTLIVGHEECDDNNTDPGDGCSRPASFQIDVSASDDGSGVESVQCRKGPRGWDGTIKGTLRVADLDGDGAVDVCVVEDAPDGVVDIEFVARDKVGHVTLIKRTFSVDGTGPTIAMNPLYSSGGGTFDRVFTSSSFNLPFTVSDVSGVDPSTVSCTVHGWDYTTKTRVAVADTDGDGMPDVCRIVEAPDGPFELEISAADVHGHVTVLKLAGEIDAIPPALTILSPSEGQTFSYGGTMRPTFTVEGTGPYTFSCMIDSIVVAANCPSSTLISLAGISSGPHVLTVTARDSAGRTSNDTVTFLIGSPPPPDVCIAIYPPPEGCPGYTPPGTTICVTQPYPVCYPAGTLPPGGGITLP